RTVAVAVGLDHREHGHARRDQRGGLAAVLSQGLEAHLRDRGSPRGPALHVLHAAPTNRFSIPSRPGLVIFATTVVPRTSLEAAVTDPARARHDDQRNPADAARHAAGDPRLGARAGGTARTGSADGARAERLQEDPRAGS